MAESQHVEATKQSAPDQGERSRESAGEAPAILLQRSVGPGFQGGRIDPRRLTPRALLALQRTVGNTAVNRLLRPIDADGTVQRSVVPVQRHDAGADLVGNKDAVVSELNAPTAGPAPATPASDATAPADATPDTTPTSSPADPAPTPAPGAPAGPAPAAPISPQAMSLTAAQTALQTAYGTVHQIVPGNIVLLDGQAPLWAAYDRINLGRNNTYVTPNHPWQNGDAQTSIPGLQGFADNPNNTVYVNRQTALVTATAHEMLHINTAADFRGAVGETVNEGTTEHLARKAVTAAGFTLGTVEAYPAQRAIVDQIIAVVGEATLTQSYFGGAPTLINAFNALQGPGKFAQLRPLAEALNAVGAAQILHPPSVAEKIANINIYLDSWWVGDDDIEAIRSICHAKPEDLPAIRAAIEPRVTDLTSIGQRTTLRAILAGA